MVKRLFLILAWLAVILPSSVGYASWETLDLPTDHGFGAIWARNGQTIFVSGDEGLWKTFDGSNWELDTALKYTHLVYFVDDTLGFARGDWLTTDGGRTWLSGDTIIGKYIIPSISFPRGQSSVGYGVWYTDTVCKTIDGGWHWDKLKPLPDVYLGFPENKQFGEINFPAFDTGYVTASCLKWISDTTVEQHQSYFKTTDGGQTWVLNEEGLWNDDFNPHLIAFPQNATVGYMAGAGKVFKTTDGGATWDTVLVDTSMSMNDMSFPETDQLGYVIGSNKAYKTTDGGNSWRKLEFGQDTILLFCHFVDNRLGFITGIDNIELCMMPYDPGFVLKTTDGLMGIAEEDWVDVEPELLEVSAPGVFSNELVVSYSSREPGRLKIALFDAAGRDVEALGLVNVNSGQGSVSFNGAGLASGVYFVRVEFESTHGYQNKTIRAVKVR